MEMQDGALGQEVGEVSEGNGYLAAGSGGEFEDTSDQSELDELDDIMVDLLCPHCDHILYRPIVLNCGHGAYFTYS
jgi:hypothetical protein